MTDEQLETTIRDKGIRTHKDTITVIIKSTERREEDFDAVRAAVKEVLNDD